MTKKFGKKLTLNKMTVTNINDEEMKSAKGGFNPHMTKTCNSCNYNCMTIYYSCFASLCCPVE